MNPYRCDYAERPPRTWPQWLRDASLSLLLGAFLGLMLQAAFSVVTFGCGPAALLQWLLELAK